MGYKPTSKIYNLQFEDYDGLEVTARSTSLGTLLDISQMQIKINESDPEKRLKIFTIFSEQLIKWNVEHPDLDKSIDRCPRCGLAAGEPLPTTVDGLLCLDLAFILNIILGWVNVISSVNMGKGRNLNNGEKNIQEELMRKLAGMQDQTKSHMPNLC